MPTMRNCSQQLGRHSRWKKSTHVNGESPQWTGIITGFASRYFPWNFTSTAVRWRLHDTLIDSDFRYKVGKKLLPIWSTDNWLFRARQRCKCRFEQSVLRYTSVIFLCIYFYYFAWLNRSFLRPLQKPTLLRYD